MWSLYLPISVCLFPVFPRLGGRARSRQLDCPLLVLLLFRRRNPLHRSLASLLIWVTISPADGSLLKHRKRSELIPISPVIPPISLDSVIPFSQHYTLIPHPEHLIFFYQRTTKFRALSNIAHRLLECFDLFLTFFWTEPLRNKK